MMNKNIKKYIYIFNLEINIKLTKKKKKKIIFFLNIQIRDIILSYIY